MLHELKISCWIIYNPNEKGYWNNQLGWVDIYAADVISLGEKNIYNLPVDGQWIEINFCNCGCHWDGYKIKHTSFCCSLSDEKYIDSTGDLDLSRYYRLIPDSYLPNT